MSETKLLPCHRKGAHCACFEQGKHCCQCGWSRPVTPDPRIAAADAMAKALEELLRARRSSRVYDVVGKHPTEGHSLNAEGMAVFNCESALAAYNSLK